MAVATTKPVPPDDDKRWKLVDVTMRRSGYAGHSLIETLHQVQSTFGYLDATAMTYVARSLRLPYSKVYGVATFYHLFTLKPHGKHTCVICNGTACYIKGAGDLLTAIQQHYGAGTGESTPDGELSVLGARCLGACGLAPAAVIDGAVLGNLSADRLLSRLEEVLAHASG